MGSNMWSANGIPAPAVHAPAYKRCVAHRWSAVPEREDLAFAPASLPTYKSYTSSQSSLREVSKPPAAVTFRHNTVNTNRVITFHSSACWREYFQASKQSDKLIVIYFTATWCGPCRYMRPILDEFAALYTDVEFDKIDVDELYTVSREFGVQTMPTFLFIKKGAVIDKVTGARKEELQRKIVKHRA